MTWQVKTNLKASTYWEPPRFEQVEAKASADQDGRLRVGATNRRKTLGIMTRTEWMTTR